jgi:hypothetical protein
MKVNLHIEEVVLQDCAAGGCERVCAAVQRELQRLIAERGLSRSLLKGADIARIDVGRLQVRPGATADHLGSELSAAAYRGLRDE